MSDHQCEGLRGMCELPAGHKEDHHESPLKNCHPDKRYTLRVCPRVQCQNEWNRMDLYSIGMADYINRLRTDNEQLLNIIEKLQIVARGRMAEPGELL